MDNVRSLETIQIFFVLINQMEDLVFVFVIQVLKVEHNTNQDTLMPETDSDGKTASDMKNEVTLKTTQKNETQLQSSMMVYLIRSNHLLNKHVTRLQVPRLTLFPQKIKT